MYEKFFKMINNDTPVKVLCYNVKEFKEFQKFLFKHGFKWNDGDEKVYTPKYSFNELFIISVSPIKSFSYEYIDENRTSFEYDFRYRDIINPIFEINFINKLFDSIV